MSKIIQVIPCVEPVYALSEGRDENGKAYFYEKCLYLCLTSDGEVYPLGFIDGGIDSFDEGYGLFGVYTKDQLPAELERLRAEGYRIYNDEEGDQ